MERVRKFGGAVAIGGAGGYCYRLYRKFFRWMWMGGVSRRLDARGRILAVIWSGGLGTCAVRGRVVKATQCALDDAVGQRYDSRLSRNCGSHMK